MNLIETDSLFLSEKTLSDIFESLQKRHINKAKTKLQKLLDDKLLAIKPTTMDNRLIHFFTRVHHILAEAMKPQQAIVPKELGQKIGNGNGLINGIKKDLNHNWGTVLARFPVHYSMATLLTKCFFNESHWHLKKSWEDWIPDLSSVALKTIKASANVKRISVEELLDYCTESPALKPNSLKNIQDILGELAEAASNQDIDKLLTEPKYAILNNPLLFPEALFTDLCDYAQADLALFFLLKCGKTMTAQLLQCITKLVEKNYFPKIMLDLTAAQMASDAGIQLLTIHQNLYILLKKIKSQHIYYEDNKIKINQQLPDLNKRLMKLLVGRLSHPCLDREKLLLASIDAIDSAMEEKEFVVNPDTIVVNFINPTFIIQFLDKQVQLSQQRLQYLATGFIKIMRSRCWLEMDTACQDLLTCIGLRLFLNDNYTLPEDCLDVFELVITKSYLQDNREPAALLLRQRCVQYEEQPITASYRVLYNILDLLITLPKQVSEQSSPSLLTDHMTTLFETLTPLLSPRRASISDTLKKTRDVLSLRFPELMPKLKEEFEKNIFFIKKTKSALAFAEAFRVRQNVISFEYIANILSCDDSLISDLKRIRFDDHLTFSLEHGFTPNSTLVTDIESKLVAINNALNKGQSVQDLEMWLMIACHYLQDPSPRQELFLAFIYGHIAFLLSAKSSQLATGMGLESKTEHNSSAPTVKQLNLADIQSNINVINDTLNKIQGSKLYHYLITEPVPIKLALYKLITWLIINEHYFDMPLGIKGLFLEISPDYSLEKMFLAYWDHLFNQPEGKISTVPMGVGYNYFIEAHHKIYTKSVEELLNDTKPMMALPFKERGELLDLQDAFQLRLLCAFFMKIQPHLQTQSALDKVTERVRSFAQVKIFPTFKAGETLLSYIKRCYEELLRLQCNYQLQSEGAKPPAKHFISIEDNLLFLKYLSIIACIATKPAEIKPSENKFLIENLVLFMSAKTAPPGVDLAVFYEVVTKGYVELRDAPVETTEIINANAYVETLLAHKLIGSAHTMVACIVKDLQADKNNSKQYLLLSWVFQYVAHVCKPLSHKPVIKDNKQFMEIFNKLEDGFIAKEFPKLTKRSLKDKLIDGMEGYAEAKELSQVLKRGKALEQKAEVDEVVAEAAGGKKKKAKKKAKSGTQSTELPRHDRGIHADAEESSASLLDPAVNPANKSREREFGASVTLREFGVSASTSGFFSQPTPNPKQSLSSISIPASSIPSSIRDLVAELSHKYPQYEFALYDLRMAELLTKQTSSGEFNLGVSVPNLRFPDDLEVLMDSSALPGVTFCKLVNNSLKLSLKDAEGVHHLSIDLVNHRPEQLPFDCIENAKHNFEGVCVVMAPGYQEEYQLYGSDKAITSLQKAEICILKEPANTLYKTNFIALLELACVELRYPKPGLTKDSTLLKLTSDFPNLRNCFCDYKRSEPKAAENIYNALLSLFYQFPMIDAIKKMNKLGALFAMAGISGPDITNALHFLAPYAHVTDPVVQVRGFCLFMMIQYAMVANDDLRKNPSNIQKWPFYDVFAQAFPDEHRQYADIILNWALGKPCSFAVDDENFFMLRTFLGRHHGYFGGEDIGRLPCAEVVEEAGFSP